MVRLTRAVVLKGISRVSVDKKDALLIDEQFGKVTSLHLQAKNIDVLDSLKLFTSLTNLYLYENHIRVIQGLEHAFNLETLHLQRNEIQRIENLEQCVNLRKLYLGYNEIQVVEGLEELRNLVELHVENQRLPRGVSLVFSPTSMETLASTLIVLNIAGNQIRSLEDISSMDSLDTLHAQKNKIDNLDDTILITSTMVKLRILNLKENPIAKDRKYKEKIIGYSDYLEVLDGKDITEVTRNFIKKFCNVKAARLKQAVKKYGDIAAAQLAAKLNPEGDTYRSPDPPSSLYVHLGSSNQPTLQQNRQQTSYNNDFNFSTPIKASSNSADTVYPSQAEWLQLVQSGNIPPDALARMRLPENIPIPDIVLSQFNATSRGQHYANNYDKSFNTTTTEEEVTTDSKDQNMLRNYVEPVSLQSPEPEINEEDMKMSEMAKVIFRLSNLSSPYTNNTQIADQQSFTPIWGKPGVSLPETRPLSPLEKPLEIRSSTSTQKSNSKKTVVPVKAGTLHPVRKTKSSNSRMVHAETALDDNPPFVTSVLELPPWPHITRRMGTRSRKISYMP